MKLSERISMVTNLRAAQRDLVTIKGHVVYDWDRAAQLVGKLEIGEEPGPTDML